MNKSKKTIDCNPDFIFLLIVTLLKLSNQIKHYLITVTTVDLGRKSDNVGSLISNGINLFWFIDFVIFVQLCFLLMRNVNHKSEKFNRTLLDIKIGLVNFIAFTGVLGFSENDKIVLFSPFSNIIIINRQGLTQVICPI